MAAMLAHDGNGHTTIIASWQYFVGHREILTYCDTPAPVMDLRWQHDYPSQTGQVAGPQQPNHGPAGADSLQFVKVIFLLRINWSLLELANRGTHPWESTQ